MATKVIGPIIQILPKVFHGVNEIIGDDKADKAFRSSWTVKTSDDLANKNPGKNIMVVGVKHDASKLVNSQHEPTTCEAPGGKHAYDVYIFDSGTFVLQGDGGFLNWSFHGNFVRDGNKVTFTKP